MATSEDQVIQTRCCSADETFEYIESPTDLSQEFDFSKIHIIPTCRSNRISALSSDQFDELLDEDGRLVDEHALRQAVFLGGSEPCVRRQVWQFLFGLYPCTSTAREREVLLMDNIVTYHELKSRWRMMLVAYSNPSATPLEQGLVAKYQLTESDGDPPTPDDLSYENALESSLENNKISINSSVSGNGTRCDIGMLAMDHFPFDIRSEEVLQMIDFMKIPAQVYVNRHKLDMRDLKKYIRVIDKDVPRTDRDYQYYSGDKNPHLGQLRDILITYTAFHPEIGYAQGMNDIIARFLAVFNSEVEAYWCFKHYMDSVQLEFLEDGMLHKINLVQKLLEELDPALQEHFNRYELGDLIFCHRWLLLGFKREFNFEDSLKCFEILSSHHLELSSLAAENTRRREMLKDFENQDGEQRTLDQDLNAEYTFELFMCVALLMQLRDQLFKCTDAAMIFQCINSLTMDLDSILHRSEQLFYHYCKKAVEDCFILIDMPHVKSRKRLLNWKT